LNLFRKHRKKIKKKFLEVSRIVAIIFLIIYVVCSVIVAFTLAGFELFRYTTNINTLIVIIAYVLKLQNKYINAIACVTFLQFYFVDFGMHLALALIQTIIIIIRVPFSKKAILTGFIFWSIYMFLVDDVFRVAGIMLIQIPNRAVFTVSVIYLLIISTLIVYFIKHKEGCLTNGSIMG